MDSSSLIQGMSLSHRGTSELRQVSGRRWLPIYLWASQQLVISLGARSFSNCPADYHINKCFYNVIWQRLILRSKVLIHISPTPTKALKKHKQAENYQGSTVSHSCLQQTLTDTYCFPGTASYAEYCLLPQSFHPRNSRRICKYAPGHIHTVFSL